MSASSPASRVGRLKLSHIFLGCPTSVTRPPEQEQSSSVTRLPDLRHSTARELLRLCSPRLHGHPDPLDFRASIRKAPLASIGLLPGTSRVTWTSRGRSPATSMHASRAWPPVQPSPMHAPSALPGTERTPPQPSEFPDVLPDLPDIRGRRPSSPVCSLMSCASTGPMVARSPALPAIFPGPMASGELPPSEAPNRAPLDADDLLNLRRPRSDARALHRLPELAASSSRTSSLAARPPSLDRPSMSGAPLAPLSRPPWSSRPSRLPSKHP